MKKNIFKTKNKFLNAIIYCCYLLLVFVIAMEIILRIYDPFPRQINGDNWEMATNTTYRLNNNFNSKLDSVITNKRNTIGFRGADPPTNVKNCMSIIAIGGSTTACTFLSEGKTWTDLLDSQLDKEYDSVWINNAGIDGHSSLGSLNFMYYYLLKLSFKPKIALFLVGANDVDRLAPVNIDPTLNNSSSQKIKKWFISNSRTFVFFQDIKSILFPQNIFGDKQNWNFKHFQSVHLSEKYIDSALQQQTEIVNGYKKRLNKIASLCIQNNIQPVFITQPSVFGDGTIEGGDPSIDFHPFGIENGQLFWRKLQLFNNATKQVSQENKITLIDLAVALAKDTAYYYDAVHYTNSGAKKISEIIYDGLKKMLDPKYDAFLKK
jgi:lysophospholipase L1-like esterase